MQTSLFRKELRNDFDMRWYHSTAQNASRSVSCLCRRLQAPEISGHQEKSETSRPQAVPDAQVLSYNRRSSQGDHNKNFHQRECMLSGEHVNGAIGTAGASHFIAILADAVTRSYVELGNGEATCRGLRPTIPSPPLDRRMGSGRSPGAVFVGVCGRTRSA